ncbi:MAG: helix-turn-helix transcriptional regulator [Betaproteobacteria bacterium]
MTTMIDGARLEELMGMSGLRQKQLADALKVDVGTISRWVRGTQKTIRSENFSKLCSILKVDGRVLSGQSDMPGSGDSRPSNIDQMNIKITGETRNAYSLVARRYRVTRQQISEAAPILFHIFAEQSLRHRVAHVKNLMEAISAVDTIKSNAYHIPNVHVSEDSIYREEDSIEQRDIFGLVAERLNDEDIGTTYPDDFEAELHNPFVSYIREAMANIGCPSQEIESVKWNPHSRPRYRICIEEALKIVGGDEKAANHILDGTALIHTMPKKLTPQERAKWAHNESARVDAELDALFDDLRKQ